MNLNSEGIVLRQTKTTGDRTMVLLFTKDYGKLSTGTSITGRKKARSSLALHPFTYGNYQIFESRNYRNIDRADVIRSFYKIGEDLDKYMYASCALELTEKILPENLPQPVVFDLLIEFLGEMQDRKKKYDTLLIAYEVKLLKILGVSPVLNRCAGCGKKEELEYFSVPAGGMYCASCVRSEEQDEINRQKTSDKRQECLIYRPDFDIMKVIRYLEKNPLTSLKKLALNQNAAEFLMDLLKKYFSYHLDVTDLKSERFFDNNR